MHPRIEKVFREVFDDEELQVPDSLSPDTYAPWDSFSQVKLIIGLSEEFGIQFTTEEVLEAHDVGAIRALLLTKGVPD
jgi:acyl carrier protein